MNCFTTILLRKINKNGGFRKGSRRFAYVLFDNTECHKQGFEEESEEIQNAVYVNQVFGAVTFFDVALAFDGCAVIIGGVA